MIFYELLSKKRTHKEIAKILGVSQSYISQIWGDLQRLKYPAVLENDNVVCFRCHRIVDQFDRGSWVIIHHSHTTGELIGLVCQGCNVRLRNESVIDPTVIILPKHKAIGLSDDDVCIIIEQGAELFGKMRLTPDAKKYLFEHQKLAEAIKKW